MFIVQVDYRNENERKRLDYIVGKWNNVIRKPDGYILEIEDEEAFSEILEEILSKFPPELVRAFRAEELKLGPERVQETRVYKLNKGIQETRTFLNFLVAKNRGIYLGKAGDAEIYDLYTRKGMVRAYITLRQEQGFTYVTLQYVGTEEAINKIMDDIEKEMRIFGEVP